MAANAVVLFFALAALFLSIYAYRQAAKADRETKKLNEILDFFVRRRLK
jgi:hypothetical protein